jgi:hypothetical protein
VTALTAHLSTSPHDKWRLRAQNHLSQALAQTGAAAP